MLKKNNSFFFRDNFSYMISFLELPLFFNNSIGSYYRFEASIYNYTEQPVLKNTILHFDLKLKFNIRLLMSMFFGPSIIKLDTFQKQKFFSSFLFNNSFNTSGFNNLINTSSNNFNFTTDSKTAFDFFDLSYNDLMINKLYKFSYHLSDYCLENLLPINKFHKIVYSGYFNFDSFISNYSSL